MLWPPLRSVTDADDADSIAGDFIDSDVRPWVEQKLTGSR